DDNGQRQAIGDKLAKLPCPVLLIWGDQDQVVPVPQPSDVPDNATLTIIPHAGHMPQMETASTVNQAILDNVNAPG
ncbi:alpha/beta fold hydrolase, partial [Mesorhizobium sp. Root102]|uniref:alpha/beta fold hydrolase n=1 Tax=Mesorhizobium sp. Root102 TaxID=1736422 RepID=UPI000A81636F